MAKQAIFDKKNILITGGAGFIGSHLCDELIKDNKIICIDNFITGSEENIDHLLQNPNFIFINHNMSEPIDLEGIRELDRFRVKFQGVQEIYNCACPTSPRHFENNIVETALANSLGIKNALDIAVKYKSKFMQMSSSVVYGPRTPEIKFYKEDYVGHVNFTGPRSCYDEGKRFGETLVTTYKQKYGIDTKIARIFRTYGKRMKLNDGQMLPDFVSNALENQPLKIYGDENFSSSFCYVSDIIQGVLKFMQSDESGPINFGSDIEYKLVDVAKKVIDLTESKSKILFRDPLLFMTPLGLPDISLAREKLSWFPIVLLEEGIQETIDYLKAHKLIIGMSSEIM